VTLVVARVFGNTVHMLADSRVTFAEERYRPAPGSVLKSVVLNPDVCVAFAGDVDRAQMAIASVNAAADIESLIDHFLHAHRDGGLNNPDFLLAIHQPGPPHLIRIWNDKVERDLINAWLGNPQAFNDLQARIGDRTETRAVDRFQLAFHELLHADDVDDIGDFMIQCYSGPDGFRYARNSGVAFWPDASTSSTEPERIGARTAAEGGYAWALLAPREPGVGAVGLYFQQGRLGCLLYPRRSDKTIRFPDIDRADFVIEVRARYGFTLWGMPSFAM
jgi:hypothetical protein